MSEDIEKPRPSVLLDLAGIWPVTHLPSGALYHCPMCGSAVFNVASHRAWHEHVGDIGNAIGRLAIEGIGRSIPSSSTMARSEDDMRIDPLRAAFNRFYREHLRAPTLIDAGSMMFAAVEAPARKHQLSSVGVLTFKGVPLRMDEGLAPWEFRLLL